VRALTPEECVTAVTKLSKDVLPRKFSIDPKNDLQILAPLHRGIGGIGNLNDQLRDALNPNGATQVMGAYAIQGRR
jgi:exodeoxyribonuclease V alpha subunit